MEYPRKLSFRHLSTAQGAWLYMCVTSEIKVRYEVPYHTYLWDPFRFRVFLSWVFGNLHYCYWCANSWNFIFCIRSLSSCRTSWFYSWRQYASSLQTGLVKWCRTTKINIRIPEYKILTVPSTLHPPQDVHGETPQTIHYGRWPYTLDSFRHYTGLDAFFFWAGTPNVRQFVHRLLSKFHFLTISPL